MKSVVAAISLLKLIWKTISTHKLLSLIIENTRAVENKSQTIASQVLGLSLIISIVCFENDFFSVSIPCQSKGIWLLLAGMLQLLLIVDE